MSPLEIGLNTTMDEILRVYPSAKLGLFRRYHIGGCTACGYQLTDTLGEVMREHSITDSLEKVIECIRESQEVETRLQILPMTVVLAIKPKDRSPQLDLQSPELAQALRRGEKLRLMDVRSRKEWEQAHLPGAGLLTMELKFEMLDSWPKDTPIVFYSNTGRRGLETASYFMAYGFTNIKNLAGGLQAWRWELEAATASRVLKGKAIPTGVTHERK